MRSAFSRFGRRASILLVVSVFALLYSQQPAAWRDPSAHASQFVTVDKNVRLEVLDWGGAGRSVVLLAGGGDTAHVFDDFAPKLTRTAHVYGITRRGFGLSDYAVPENVADRLGDDLVAVLDKLNLKRPVLVGHSIAGRELSSIANRYPGRVAGLVYLDAGYPYAFDNGRGPSMQEYLDITGPQPPPPNEKDRASFAALRLYYLRVFGFTFPEAELRQRWSPTPDGRVEKQRHSPGYAILLRGMEKYADIPAPALLLFANPHSQGKWVDHNKDAKIRAAAMAYSAKLSPLVEWQIKAVKDGVPAARVVTIDRAHHHIYLSNEREVLREINSFLTRLR